MGQIFINEILKIQIYQTHHCIFTIGAKSSILSWEVDFKDFIIAVKMVFIFIHFGPLILFLSKQGTDKVTY